MSLPTYTLRRAHDRHTGALESETVQAGRPRAALGLARPYAWLDLYTAPRGMVQRRLTAWGLDPQAELGASTPNARSAVWACALDAVCGGGG
jgi:hypothetical protein